MKAPKRKQPKPLKRKLIPTGERWPDGNGGEWRLVNVVVGGKIINTTLTR